MVVDSVESTPNPSSFLLRLDAAPEGLAATGLRGQTFYGGDLLCPPAMAAALATEGVESIFACGNMLTVNKVAAAQWEAVLPSVVEALGGASEALAASGLQPATDGGAAGGGASSGGVSIRLQVSQKLPIQVEASGWLGSPPVRAKLSTRFAGAMGLLVERSGDSAFFEGRRWIERGLRYPEVELDPEQPFESEAAAVAAALASELED